MAAFPAFLRVMRGAVVAMVVLSVAACEADRPVITKIERTSQAAAACDRFREIGQPNFDVVNRQHAIDGALCWIERNSSYRNLPPPELWLELTPQHIASLGSRSVVGASAAALYSCRQAAMYFKKGFDHTKLGDQSVLVHELVHHAQCVHMRLPNSPANVCTNETEAYTLQAKFVREVATRMTDQAEKARVMGGADMAEKTAAALCRGLGK